MTLGKAEILAADDIKTEVVDVPEWGGSVRVRLLSVGEFSRFEALTKGKDSAAILATLVGLSVIDDEGKPLFDDADIDKLATKSAAALLRIADAAKRLNNLTDDDVEMLEKN